MKPATTPAGLALVAICFATIPERVHSQSTLGVPTSVAVSAPTTEALTVTWNAPSSDGGTTIASYDLRYIETTAPDKADTLWTVIEVVWTSGTLEYDLAGLLDGVEYDVELRAANGTEGDWSATATGTTTDHSATTSAATTLTVASPMVGAIYTGGDEDLFKIVLAAATDIWLYTDADFDAELELLNSGGSRVTSNDDGHLPHGPLNASIRRELGAGTHYVRVKGNTATGTGVYSLHSQSVTDPGSTLATATTIEAGTAYPGRIGPSGGLNGDHDVGAVLDATNQPEQSVTVTADDGKNGGRASIEVTITVTTGPVGPPVITGGGGGGGGPSGPSPSTVDFEWTVTRDIDELDSDHGSPTGAWSDGATLWLLENGAGAAAALYAYDLATGESLAEYALASANDDPHGIWSDGVTVWVSNHDPKHLFAYRLPVQEAEEPTEGEDEAAEVESLERVRDEEFDKLSRASNNSPRGIWSDGDARYITDESDDRVYSHNMPDAIDARLASLTLSGLDIGEFDSRRTDYEGVPGEGVTETTVEATTVQRRTDVTIHPPDADGNEANGHQVSLQGVEEITVTVTSADGSRVRVYRVTTEVPVVELALEAGFNSIEWPGADGVPVVDVFRDGGVADEVLVVYQWDEVAESWSAYFPGLEDVPGLNTLTTLQQGSTYWVAVAEPLTWTVPAP